MNNITVKWESSWENMDKICSVCGHRFGLHYGNEQRGYDCPLPGQFGLYREDDVSKRTYFRAGPAPVDMEALLLL